MDNNHIPYAKGSPSMIRGWHNWSSGVTVDDLYSGIFLVSHENGEHYQQTLIALLRDAGWTVTDDGRIIAEPPHAAKG